MVSGTSFISKKIKESHQKTYPLDTGSEIWDPDKIHPGSGFQIQGGKKALDPGGKKAPDPDLQHCRGLKKVIVPTLLHFCIGIT
jgi:hypothetical protein